MNKRIGLMAAGLAGALVLAGGAAFGAVSSIPDSAGVIHGCYDSGGNVKVIDTSVTTTCPKGYSALNWNQTGPAGQQGPKGISGSSIVTSQGAPSGSCTTGDTDIDLADGEVYTCTASAWTDIRSSVKGPPGPPGASSLDAMNGSPCNDGAGTLQVTYTPQGDGTDSVSIVCGQNSTINLTINTPGASIDCFGGVCATAYGQVNVTSSPAGINCGRINPADSGDTSAQGTCTAEFAGGTVTLTATLGLFSQFAASPWTGCDSISADNTTCTVSVSTLRDVTLTVAYL
jgi:hypothetical protein